MEMTLCESSAFRVCPALAVDQVVEPTARRATTALRSDVYQAAYW